MPKLSTSIAILCFIFPTFAHAATSLCLANEDVLLSCRASKKFISICASRDLSGTNGYIKYRFGSRDKVELEHPKGNEHPSKVFTFKATMGAHGGTEALRFKNGEYAYTVWQLWDRGIDDRGVTVKHDGKTISQLMCRSERIGDWSLDTEIERMRKAGMPEPSPQDDDAL